jgi:hypothetical protein
MFQSPPGVEFEHTDQFLQLRRNATCYEAQAAGNQGRGREAVGAISLVESLRSRQTQGTAKDRCHWAGFGFHSAAIFFAFAI